MRRNKRKRRGGNADKIRSLNLNDLPKRKIRKKNLLGLLYLRQNCIVRRYSEIYYNIFYFDRATRKTLENNFMPYHRQSPHGSHQFSHHY